MNARQWWVVQDGNVFLEKDYRIPDSPQSVRNVEAEKFDRKFDPLKYRGVFDRPIISTRNLLPSRDMTLGEEITQEHRESANPPNTSQHVLEFFGFSGGCKPKYLGGPRTARVLDQREAWIQIWLQKGRYEHEKEQLRIAARGFQKATGVSAKKSA